MWKKKFGLRSLAVFYVACFGSGAAAAHLLGLRLNTSYSLPLGLYQVTTDETAPLIEFCPVEPFASESAARGYRTRGLTCPDGAVPLLKPVVARAGDMIELTAAGIHVNGCLLKKTAPVPQDAAGRKLRAWPQGRYRVAPGTVWVASTYNAGSYDSRYMGPIDTKLIRRRLRPLWTFSA